MLRTRFVSLVDYINRYIIVAEWMLYFLVYLHEIIIIIVVVLEYYKF